MVVTSNFSFPVGFSWVFSSLSSTSFFSRVRRGEVTSARFGMNFPKCVIMPKNCSIFAWSTFIRSDDIIRPRNTIDFTPIWHLFLFSFSQLLRIFKNTLFKRSLCSARVLPLPLVRNVPFGFSMITRFFNQSAGFRSVQFFF